MAAQCEETSAEKARIRCITYDTIKHGHEELWYHFEMRDVTGSTLAISYQNLECAGIIWS